MNLFIDTNIFLSFFHLTDENLEELKKLLVLMRNKTIRLFLPDQVVDEFQRNRENKLFDALKKLDEAKLNLAFPSFCKGYSEYEQLQQKLKEFSGLHSSLREKLKQDIATHALGADKLAEQLFSLAQRIPHSGALVESARLRHTLGNPPGKSDSIGDALNWEALLQAVPAGEPLFMVADDKDYYSPLDPEQLRPFLKEEWRRVKQAEIVSYRRLSAFFKEHFPSVKFASDLEQQIAVEDFIVASSFADTHQAVEKLSGYRHFLPGQLALIIEAAISNNQIAWIASDDDVFQFLSRVAAEAKGKVPNTASLGELEELLNRAKQS